MNRLRKAALALYAINVFFGMVVGVVYLSRSEFMPYHAEAAGMDWAQVPANMRVLLLALIHMVGGLGLGVSAALAAILIFAFRRGEPWADWVVPTLLLPMQMLALIVPLEVALKTGAHTPWWGSLGGLCITLVAMRLTASDRKRNLQASRAAAR